MLTDQQRDDIVFALSDTAEKAYLNDATLYNVLRKLQKAVQDEDKDTLFKLNQVFKEQGYPWL